MRAPRLRDPQSFSDVFTVIALTVGVVALALSLTDSQLVRLEMIVVFAIVVTWVVWAVNHILERSRPY